MSPDPAGKQASTLTAGLPISDNTNPHGIKTEQQIFKLHPINP